MNNCFELNTESHAHCKECVLYEIPSHNFQYLKNDSTISLQVPHSWRYSERSGPCTLPLGWANRDSQEIKTNTKKCQHKISHILYGMRNKGHTSNKTKH